VITGEAVDSASLDERLSIIPGVPQLVVGGKPRRSAAKEAMNQGIKVMVSILSLLRRCILSGGILVLFCANADAMFRRPEPTPVNRLLGNAETYLERHPGDPGAHYTLARIHYLAFHLKTAQIPAFRFDEHADQLPPVAPRWMTDAALSDTKPAAFTDEQLIGHARSAIAEFHTTIELDANNALAQLGIASLLEEFRAWNTDGKIARLPSELAGITPAVLRLEYTKAMRLAMPEDAKLQYLPPTYLSGIISYEAASALVRLANDGKETLTSQERDDVTQAEVALEHFKSLKPGSVTPIVFSFQQVDHLDALLAPDTPVNFDLRGFGPRERWSWVKPQLGLLVWDPARTGRIHSARQLFGGYTFEIFRANGYDALAALDDNGDGVLSGEELDGISVWFNRNSDGVATRDEVIPLRDLGIMSIAVTMDGHDGIHPTNERGVTMRDGRTLRTWDWIATPVVETSVAGAR
jgi:hypothetical protein